jgi:methylmalonyl-CoA mutase, N-terminal domain
VQSMFTAAWDEPFALPSEASTTLALRTQQVLAHETGVTRVADPLGGSYYVEALTDATEERIIEIMSEVEAHGGMVAGVENGLVQKLIADEAYDLHRALETGRRTVVGLNRFATDEAAPDVEVYELDEANLRRQLERLDETRRTREDAVVRRSLGELAAAARADDVNLMPRLVDCAHAYCTVGEMVAVLKDVWGQFRQPAVF